MILLISILVSVGSVIIMWAYMCNVSAQRNGWQELVQHYGVADNFRGQRFGGQSATLNGFAFTATLTLGASAEGLYLRGGPLLYLFHTPLVVPWSDLRAESFKRAHSAGYSFSFEPLPSMSLEMSQAAVGRLAEVVDPSWGITPPWDC